MQNKQGDNKGGNQHTPPKSDAISKEQAEQLLDSYKQSDEQTRKRVEQLKQAAQQERNQKNKNRW